MKVGDLVWFVVPHNNLNTYGLIIEQVHDPLALGNEVFKVLWHDGTIGNYVWGCDLVPLQGYLAGYYGAINESR